MPSNEINLSRLLVAGLAAGGWVFASGLLMAGAFGYRDMKAAFDALGLPIPVGAGPFVVHTLVRLLIGMALVTLFAILLRVTTPTMAMLTAVGFTWLLGALLPFAVVVEWGLFSWWLAAKMWAWSAMELLIAGAIGRWLYLRMGA
ncbi:MAG: hypothetical protein Q8W45_00105 [Candidatus Palauibacterales bacterium]|jgi:hypothetical protein|nr:hypothetical protein [Candidatus Palauibacterales bacterium]MDP2481655.1 hypothetical protein [Candidatus Palauibacterales bacterium]